MRGLSSRHWFSTGFTLTPPILYIHLLALSQTGACTPNVVPFFQKTPPVDGMSLGPKADGLKHTDTHTHTKYRSCKSTQPSITSTSHTDWYSTAYLTLQLFTLKNPPFWGVLKQAPHGHVPLFPSRTQTFVWHLDQIFTCYTSRWPWQGRIANMLLRMDNAWICPSTPWYPSENPQAPKFPRTFSDTHGQWRVRLWRWTPCRKAMETGRSQAF